MIEEPMHVIILKLKYQIKKVIVEINVHFLPPTERLMLTLTLDLFPRQDVFNRRRELVANSSSRHKTADVSDTKRKYVGANENQGRLIVGLQWHASEKKILSLSYFSESYPYI